MSESASPETHHTGGLHDTSFSPRLELDTGRPDDDFDEAVRIAQAEFDRHQPDVVVGSSRGGAVAMNQKIDVPLVLLCPAWKRWGAATTVKPGTVILHSQADETIPFADSQELLRNSGIPDSALIVVGHEHRLADPESLAKMLEAVEKTAGNGDQGFICPTCEHYHAELPMDFAVDPYPYLTIPADERHSRCYLTSDLCVIDEKDFFIRGCFEILVLDGPRPFVWSVWVSLSEMAQASLDVGFGHLGFPEIGLWTLPINLASQRVMGKLGFRYERDFEFAGLLHRFYRLAIAFRVQA